MTHQPWRTLSRTTLLSLPPWLEVGTETVELPDGRVIEDYLWLDHGDFVNVVALTAQGDVICLRSYRHGPREVSLQFPAGLMEPGEEPLAAAKRELLEETGYTASRWLPLGRFCLDSNWGGAWMHTFLAEGAIPQQAADDGDLEDIEVILLPLAETKERVLSGEVKLLTHVAAFSLAMMSLERSGDRNSD